MPKYFQHKVAGYYIYYTEHCIAEAMHAHASDKRLSESGSAKFFIKSNGDSEVQKKGALSDIEIRKIQRYIKLHYIEMYELWTQDSSTGFYGED